MIQGSSHKVVAWPLDLRIPSFSYQFAQGVEGVRRLAEQMFIPFHLLEVRFKMI